MGVPRRPEDLIRHDCLHYRVPTTGKLLPWQFCRDGVPIELDLPVKMIANTLDPQLRFAALPALRSLAEQAGATAHLTVADGAEAQAVAVVEPSWTAYHVAYRVGSRHRVDQGAGGRAIDLGPDDEPWLTSSGELQPGAYGLAAPVRGVIGLRASVGIIALEPFDADDLGPYVVKAAAEVSIALS